MEFLRSIIVPAFNEEASICAVLDDLAANFPEATEILVIDGGSDATGTLVRAREASMPGLRYIAHPNDRGKGHAIRTGMSLSCGRYQGQLDSDGQFLASDLRALFQALESGEADVVLGSRFLPQSGRDEAASRIRDWGNALVSGWLSFLFGRKLTDGLAGIKAWRSDAVGRLDLQSDGFEYEVEIPARALRRGLRVIELPVTTRAREAGDSKVSVFRVGLRVCIALINFRCQK